MEKIWIRVRDGEGESRKCCIKRKPVWFLYFRCSGRGEESFSDQLRTELKCRLAKFNRTSTCPLWEGLDLLLGVILVYEPVGSK